MGETANIAEIASRVSREIFKHFWWHAHPRTDDNFSCVNEAHESSSGGRKRTHPTDVVFSYDDPYLGRRIHLLTDLKSYGKDSITHGKLRGALKSLAGSVECAKLSDEWRSKFSVDVSNGNEVRGLLFVHNHDNGYEKCFQQELDKVNLQTLPIQKNQVLHFLGPRDIQRLYNTANDILRLKAEGELPYEYSFYYPDLVMRRRHGDVWDQAATFEALSGPFVILRHKATAQRQAGYVIYYNRPGGCAEEFEYLIDCFSRFQMLEAEEGIRIRVTNQDAHDDLKSHFELAKRKYSRAWGFDEAREGILKKIEIDRLNAVTALYHPGDAGWER